MHEPALPPDEAERLAAVDDLGLFGRDGEEAFAPIVRTAAAATGMPVVFVSIIGADEQWMSACVGLPGGASPRRESFCGHTILADGPLLIEDARTDERFHDNPWVTSDAPIIAYAGIPLRDPLTNRRVGTLCLVDHEPRQFDDETVLLLRDLAGWAESEFARIHLARTRASLEVSRREATAAAERSDLVLNAVAEGIYGLDTDGRVTFVNVAGASLLGVSQRELLGQQLHERHHGTREDGTTVPWSACPTAATLRDGRARRIPDDAYQRSDGAWVAVEASQTPILRDGAVAGAVLTLLDVSDRREVERVKAEFVSTVSHELRTPLTAIKGSLGLLAGGVYGELPPQAAGMVGVGIRNADRLVRLIEDVLDLERIADGRTMRLARRDIAAVVGQAADDLRQSVGDAGLEFTIDVEPAELLVDEDRIVQVVTNLVANAVKFTPPGGRVSVRGRLSEATYLLEVSDTGRGIAADQLAAVFDRFHQVDASDTREHGGTGLGLAIVRSLVEAHSGSVWVESAVGQGSTFHVQLPARRRVLGAIVVDVVDDEVLPVELPALGTHVTGDVLVVEDETDVALQVRAALEAAGCTVTVVDGEAAAVAAVERHTPRAVVLDLRLVEGDGYGFVRWLQAHRPQPTVPMVVFTVLDEREVDRELLDYGSPEVLTKSATDLEVLADRVRGLLDRDQEG